MESYQSEDSIQIQVMICDWLAYFMLIKRLTCSKLHLDLPPEVSLCERESIDGLTHLSGSGPIDGRQNGHQVLQMATWSKGHHQGHRPV